MYYNYNYDYRNQNGNRFVFPFLLGGLAGGALVMPHRVCKACGAYNKKEVVKVQ